MAMTMKTEGLTELSEILTRLEEKAEDVATGAVFDGAAVVADAFTAAANSIKTEPFHYLAMPELAGKKRLPSPEEKAAVIGKSGIAKFHKNGSEVDTLIGITGNSGYANINGKQKAVRMSARAINSGTSFMTRQPVFLKAKTQSEGKAKEAMVDKAETMLENIING